MQMHFKLLKIVECKCKLRSFYSYYQFNPNLAHINDIFVFLSVCLPVSIRFKPNVFLSVFLSVSIRCYFLFVCLSVSTYLFVCLSLLVCLFVCLSFCLFICICIDSSLFTLCSLVFLCSLVSFYLSFCLFVFLCLFGFL